MPKRLVPSGTFGTRVYRAMIRKTKPDGTAWHPEDLAREIGVSPTTVRNWIARGVTPDGDKLSALAQALGMSVEDLVRGSNFTDKADKSAAIGDPERLRDGRTAPAPQAAQIARILADAFLRIADLLSADHPAARQTPPLEAADRIVHASKDAEKAQEPARKREHAG